MDRPRSSSSSNPGQNPYNAIDPAILQTSDGKIWMSFGSFWNGIYLTELDPATGKRITPNSTTYSIARHPVRPPNAIEAPYIFERDGYYYLFVNWDTCCQGTNSTYNIRVGRSTNITGPYVDQSGVPLTYGGGTLFLATQGSFIGPGHISIFTDELGTERFGYHYYDGGDNGTSKYNLRQIFWHENGWPSIAPTAPDVRGTTTAMAASTPPTTCCGATRWALSSNFEPMGRAIWSSMATIGARGGQISAKSLA